MALQLKPMVRQFSYNGVKLPDPNPSMTVEQVRAQYVPRYPDITTASIEGPEAVDGKQVYRFTRAVGSKG